MIEQINITVYYLTTYINIQSFFNSRSFQRFINLFYNNQKRYKIQRQNIFQKTFHELQGHLRYRRIWHINSILKLNDYDTK